MSRKNHPALSSAASRHCLKPYLPIRVIKSEPVVKRKQFSAKVWTAMTVCLVYAISANWVLFRQTTIRIRDTVAINCALEVVPAFPSRVLYLEEDMAVWWQMNTLATGVTHKRPRDSSDSAKAEEDQENRYPEQFISRERTGNKSCVEMADWQKSAFPTCNNMHEIDMADDGHLTRIKWIASGGHRDVWKITTSGSTSAHESTVMKTLR